MIKRFIAFLEGLNERRFLFWAFLAAVVIRTVYTVLYYQKNHFNNFVDDLDYISYAEQIIEQGITVHDIDKIYGNGHQVSVGWPAIMAGFFLLFGKNYLLLFALNILLGGGLIILIYRIGKEVFSKPAAVLAAAWSVPYVKFIKYCPTLLKENLIHFMLALTLLIFLRALRSGDRKKLLLFILVYTAFIHIDERYFMLSPVFFAALLFYWPGGWRKGYLPALSYAGLVALFMIPWTVRNYHVYKRPVLLSIQTAAFTDKLIGYTPAPGEDGAEGMADSYNRKNLPLYEEFTRKIIRHDSIDPEVYGDYKFVRSMEKAILKGDTPVTFSKARNYLADFTEFYRPCRFRAGFIGNGYRYEDRWPLLNNTIVLIQYGIPLLLFLVALLFRKLSREHIFLVAILLVYTLIHVFIAHAVERYRTPIDFIIFLFGMWFLVNILQRFDGRSAGA